MEFGWPLVQILARIGVERLYAPPQLIASYSWILHILFVLWDMPRQHRFGFLAKSCCTDLYYQLVLKHARSLKLPWVKGLKAYYKVFNPKPSKSLKHAREAKVACSQRVWGTFGISYFKKSKSSKHVRDPIAACSHRIWGLWKNLFFLRGKEFETCSRVSSGMGSKTLKHVSKSQFPKP